MKGLLLISHGNLAKGLYETTTWFFGDDIEQCAYLTLMADDSVDAFTERIVQTINQLDSGEGVVVMCDLFGGSPFKCALASVLTNENIKLFTGMNLPMVMEFLGKRLCGEYDFEGLLSSAKEGIIDFVAEKQDDQDDE
ncbi:MAG: PTS sugar transporter subunit IIA [Erysipelotrichaceae bacterium]